MAPNSSNLSDAHYGYDLVLSTTQESINAGLLQYLMNTKNTQPYSYLFFAVDDTGTPSVRKSLQEVLWATGGLNPFDVPMAPTQMITAFRSFRNCVWVAASV